MDPNTALRILNEAPKMTRATHEAASALSMWLLGGGFPPHWNFYPRGTKRFRKLYGYRPSMGEQYR
jgi:hypothetical protein